MLPASVLNAETLPSGVKQTTRYYALDALRTSMLLLGIVLHLTLPYVGYTLPGYYVTNERRPILYLIFILHYFRMPTFFVLSGFFSALLWERGGTYKFLQNRLQRIGLVWIASLTVLSPVIVVISVYNHFASKSGDALLSTWRAISSFRIDASWLQVAPIHLWFLEYLLLFCLVAAVILKINKGVPPVLDHWISKIIGWRFRIVVLAIPTTATLWHMPLAVVPYPTSFVPWLGVSLAYGWFYAVGWLMYHQRDKLPFMTGRALFEKVVAPVLIIVCLRLIEKRLHLGPRTNTLVLDIAIALLTALFMWSTVIALIAAFHFIKPNKRLPYLADASYWMYLMHFPFALLLPAVLRHWSVSPVIKVGFSTAFIFFLLLWMYNQFVRYTIVGRILNGTRHHPRVSRPKIAVSTAEL